MIKPNISLSNTTKIESIEFIDTNSTKLYDLSVDIDHTFWVSQDEKHWVATHNSGSPDIDCVHEDHLVVMADGSHERVRSIVKGDVVLGGDGNAHVVTATYRRSLRLYESVVWVLVEASDGTLGHIACVPGHKFVKDDGEVVYCHELKVGDKLMATCPVVVKQIELGGQSSAEFIDVTIEGDHRFHVVPFDVTVSKSGKVLYSASYCRGVVPGTFICCGEDEGRYCSDWCTERARIDQLETFIGAFST